jgi:4,5-DOPA dioxygenase extradiol
MSAMSTPRPAPSLFVAHASPMLALEREGHAEALRAFGRRFPDPAGIAIVSAHWEAPGPVRVNAVALPSLIYDFGGFPRALYEMTYPAPGAPELAAQVLDLLGKEGIPAAPERARGWDHGVWIPLKLLYPDARAPVVEISLPLPRDPRLVTDIGRALSPLRDRGVLVVGSGGIVHNLRLARFDRKDAPVDAWASEFDSWVREQVERRDVASLADYERAPGASRAVAETEHFDPVFVALGAARENDRLEEIDRGFEHGNISLASYAFVPERAA